MSKITLGNLRIDRDRFEVWVAGRRVQLTYFEFELLWQLARHTGRVVSRNHLLRTVWQDAETNDRKLNIQVCRLRAKLRGANCEIATLAKRGYCFTGPATPSGVMVRATARPSAIASLFVLGRVPMPGHGVVPAAAVLVACLVALLFAVGELELGRRVTLALATAVACLTGFVTTVGHRLQRLAAPARA